MTAHLRSRPDRRRPRFALTVAALLALGFVGGTVLAPLLTAAGEPAGALLRVAYAPLCHQLPERSFTVGGVAMAVCARCSGLYLGGMAGLILAAAIGLGDGRRPRAAWLAWACAPTVLDGALALLGAPSLPALPRFLLALPAGVMAGLFLAVGLADLFTAKPQRTPAGPVPPRASLEVFDG